MLLCEKVFGPIQVSFPPPLNFTHNDSDEFWYCRRITLVNKKICFKMINSCVKRNKLYKPTWPYASKKIIPSMMKRNIFHGTVFACKDAFRGIDCTHLVGCISGLFNKFFDLHYVFRYIAEAWEPGGQVFNLRDLIVQWWNCFQQILYCV